MPNLTKRQRAQLEVQEWRCAYPCDSPIFPGDELALCYDGTGIVHLRCASIGFAPERDADHG